MKRFLSRLFIFFLPFLVVTVFFEIYLRSVNTIYKEKLSGLHKNEKKAEMLLFGNSHANYDIDPNQLDAKAYNMAMVNQSWFYDYAIFNKEINKLPNLKYVVLSLDYHTLYFSSQGLRDNWIYYDYGIDNNIDWATKASRFWFGYTPKIAFAMLKSDINKRFVSFRKHKKTVNYHVENGVDILDTMSNGWIPYKAGKVKKIKEKSAKKRAAIFNSKINNLGERQRNIKLLKSFLKELKERNIIPIIVTLPCHELYIKNINNAVREKDSKEVASIVNQYGGAYFDYLHFVKDDSMYYDCDHMNRKGAAYFTKQLNHDIITKFPQHAAKN
jgi:hypothetical protein